MLMKKILYVDMDGVIADFNEAIYNLIPNLDELEDSQREYMVDSTCVKNPSIFLHLNPIEYSINYVKELWDLYDVYFLSTPMNCLPESFMHKRMWLQRHFGEMVDRRLILTHRKDLCIGDYLIDDRTKNGAGEFRGEHIHLWQGEWQNWHVVRDYLVEEILRDQWVERN